MAIAVQGSGSSATTTVTIPAHAVGDTLIIMARGTAAPTIPAAGGTVPTWTEIDTGGVNNSIGWRVARAVATATTHTSGTWTGAAQMHVLVLRPSAGTLVLGNIGAQAGANTTQTIIYPAVNATAGASDRLAVRYGARGVADTEVRTDGAFTTGGTFRTEQPATTPTSAVFTKPITANEGAFTATPAGTNAAYRAGSFEIVNFVPTATSVARVSLAAGSEPGTRTAHSLKLRARKASGTGTVLLNAALYEGATNRSGDLASSALTTSLADYTLAIPDVSAAAITSYADLELRLWATSATGDAVAVEVAEAWLETPASTGPQTHFGATAMPITVARAVAGTRRTFGGTARPITFAASVAGVASPPAVTHFGSTSLAAAFGAVTQGRRKAFGVIARPSTFAAVIQGQRKAFGVVARPVAFAVTVAGQRKTFGVVARPVTFAAVTAGRRKALGAVALPVAFGAVTAAQRRTFGQVARPITFAALVDGRKLAAGIYGSVAATWSFGSATAGRRRTFGIVARPFTFAAQVAGRRRTFGAVALELVLGELTAARLHAFGRAELEFVFDAIVAGELEAAFGELPELVVAVVGVTRPRVIVVAGARPEVNGVAAAPAVTAAAVDARPTVVATVDPTVRVSARGRGN